MLFRDGLGKRHRERGALLRDGCHLNRPVQGFRDDIMHYGQP